MSKAIRIQVPDINVNQKNNRKIKEYIGKPLKNKRRYIKINNKCRMNPIIP